MRNVLLSSANLENAKLHRTELSGANLSKTELKNAELYGAVLSHIGEGESTLEIEVVRDETTGEGYRVGITDSDETAHVK